MRKAKIITKAYGILIFLFVFFGIFFCIFGNFLTKKNIKETCNMKIEQYIISEKTNSAKGFIANTAKYKIILFNNQSDKKEEIYVPVNIYNSYNNGDIIECKCYYNRNNELKLIEINEN